ncbi:hypothetical protein OAH28_01940 [Hyphomicrobiales bacterium]|nr:hypothetical protein [Hyphomicrobiales bacterium]
MKRQKGNTMTNNSQKQATYSILEFAEALSVSRGMIDKHIKNGNLMTIKLGERRLIVESPQEFIERYKKA